MSFVDFMANFNVFGAARDLFLDIRHGPNGSDIFVSPCAALPSVAALEKLMRDSEITHWGGCYLSGYLSVTVAGDDAARARQVIEQKVQGER